MPLRNRHGMWHYRFWLDGREYTANTGLVATERNKIAAARAEAKARELVLSGRAHELKLEIKPFSDAVGEFLTWADGEYTDHPEHGERLRTSFREPCANSFANAPVSSILRGHVNDYKAWRRKEHQVREITIRHDLHALSKAFGYFIDHNWARENPPVRGVEIPSDKDAVRIHVLTANEETMYFEAAQRYPALYDLGRLMLNQGCRPEEILDLQVDDIDLERPTADYSHRKVAGGLSQTPTHTRKSGDMRAARLASRHAGCFPARLRERVSSNSTGGTMTFWKPSRRANAAIGVTSTRTEMRCVAGALRSEKSRGSRSCSTISDTRSQPARLNPVCPWRRWPRSSDTLTSGAS